MYARSSTVSLSNVSASDIVADLGGLVHATGAAVITASNINAAGLTTNNAGSAAGIPAEGA